MFGTESEETMGYAIVSLKKGEGRTVKSGGMWVYDNEIALRMGRLSLYMILTAIL